MYRVENIIGSSLCAIAIVMLIFAYMKGKKDAWKMRRRGTK
jgi:uncharacterized membrane protein YidH (DUF202 family)